ncbi:putative DNA topoisomerase [Medicago truncatula]|uniref:DNA topoisomerase n=1 Tax=Medicago truncatula TaxID=3880 RepID=A0A396J882_MEDTR|nr:putative DNA topoisomerase [Medicago truncatula]RHN74493.1 putative DNA topoisomerase [Medicago truncatula]
MTELETTLPSLRFTGKSLYPPVGKSVVVVESLDKARTIRSYLGGMYEVLSCNGLVMDLDPGQNSASLDNDFCLFWEISNSSQTRVKRISAALKGVNNLIFAFDPSPEGETIAWQIIHILRKKHRSLQEDILLARVVFNEITEQSIKAALQEPREIDMNLVNSYLAKRVIDFLFGFNISPLVLRKLPSCKSPRRFEFPALSLLCDRESEINSFRSREYWTLYPQLQRTNRDLPFRTLLTHIDSRELNKFSVASVEEANEIQSRIYSAQFQVIGITRSKISKMSPTPYSTSTLQQDAARILNFSSSITMKIARKLYEGVKFHKNIRAGLITCFITDGLHVGSHTSLRKLFRIFDPLSFKGDVCFFILLFNLLMFATGTSILLNIQSIHSYGQNFVAQSPPENVIKVKNALESHEAIRPTDIRKLPSMLAGVLDKESLKLYTLIWFRTISCQMEPAILEKVRIQNIHQEKV